MRVRGEGEAKGEACGEGWAAVCVRAERIPAVAAGALRRPPPAPPAPCAPTPIPQPTHVLSATHRRHRQLPSAGRPLWSPGVRPWHHPQPRRRCCAQPEEPPWSCRSGRRGCRSRLGRRRHGLSRGRGLPCPRDFSGRSRQRRRRRRRRGGGAAGGGGRRLQHCARLPPWHGHLSWTGRPTAPCRRLT